MGFIQVLTILFFDIEAKILKLSSLLFINSSLKKKKKKSGI